MEPSRYLQLLRSDGTLLAETARRGLSAPVPACPGWTVGDVVRHTGVVYRRRIDAVRRRGSEPPPGEDAGPPPGVDPVEWYVGLLDELVATLRDAGPDAPAWTWVPSDRTAGFWFRRMAQETAVHRVDVQSAFGDVTPVDAELAADGVDEVLDRFLVRWARRAGLTARVGAVAVHTDGRWWGVLLAGADTSLTREPGPAVATLGGGPSEVLLWLWGRRPRKAVVVDGDEAAVAALRQALVAVTQ